MATQLWTGSPYVVWNSQPRFAFRGMYDYSTQWTVLKVGLFIADAVVIAASLFLAYQLRISSGILYYNPPAIDTNYGMVTVVAVPIWLALFAVFGLYRPDNLLGGLVEYRHAAKACMVGVVALVVLSFLSRELVEVSRLWLVFSGLFSVALVFASRYAIRHFVYRLRRSGNWLTARVLITGANAQGVAMARQWAGNPNSGMQVVGFLDDFKPQGTAVLGDLKVLGPVSSLMHTVRVVGANEVVVVPNAVAWETFEELIAQARQAEGFILRISPGFYELLPTGVAVTNKSFVPLFTINENRIVGMDAILKKALDYGVALPLSLITLPAAVIIALVLKRSRPSKPVLLRMRAVGQSGKDFTLWKFNVEQPEADGAIHPWIYRFGLDKLPQLANVLMGQMSLVGTRPVVLDADESDSDRGANTRAMQPGVVGPWAVNELWTSSDEMRDDMYYVRNWTIGLDLQILFQVVLTLFGIGRRVRPANTL